jgi:hypothetical protein
MEFPEGGEITGIGNGQHFWLPHLPHGFDWGYGAPKGTNEAFFWEPYLAHLELTGTERLALRNFGFCGTLILKAPSSTNRRFSYSISKFMYQGE